MGERRVEMFNSIASELHAPGELYQRGATLSAGGAGQHQHRSRALQRRRPGVRCTAAGEIQMLLTPASEAMALIKAGRLRPIAVSSEKRTTQLPEVPTIGETIPGYEFTSWMAAFAPAGTSKAIVERLNAELRKAVADAGVASNLSNQTLDPMHMTTDEFAKTLKAEYDKYENVVKLSGARLD
jgi:tripartite-type tricarboxylate transporter receptor subunit TctC